MLVGGCERPRSTPCGRTPCKGSQTPVRQGAARLARHACERLAWPGQPPCVAEGRWLRRPAAGPVEKHLVQCCRLGAMGSLGAPRRASVCRKQTCFKNLPGCCVWQTHCCFSCTVCSGAQGIERNAAVIARGGRRAAWASELEDT